MKYFSDYAATPNVSLFLGKSVTTDKPSPHMIDLNNSRVARLILLGDTKAITGNVGYIKTISSNCVSILLVKHTNPTWQRPENSSLCRGSYPFADSELSGRLHYPRNFLQWSLKLPRHLLMRSDHIANNYAISIDECYSRYKVWYKQYVSNRSINLQLGGFFIRIKNVPSSDSSRMIESIIGYRFNN
ncbi:hypothetical protein H8356DRAFT_1356128 [Neocallimastix lanati (nom. inval.)]|nr:hypothetical protein H8356DRAFT_1356128 [Neocallimastix sp. JGI-2020a]